MFEREGVCPATPPGGSPWWDRHDEEVAFIAALNAELVAEGYVEGEGEGEGEGWDWDDDGAAGEVESAGPVPLDADPLDPRRLETDPLERFRSPDAEALALMMPGAGLAFALEEADVTSVDTYGVVEVVAAWFRVVGWAQAGMARAAAELHRRVRRYEASPSVTHRVVRGRRSAGRTGAAAHEIALRLGLTRQAAQAVIDDGLAFDEALAPVGEFLASGRIDLARARAFVDALGDSPAPTAVDVQEVVLPRAPSRTAPEVRRDLAAALIAVDPADATARHARARDGRRVNHPAVLPDGMAALYAVMPAVDLVALDIALDAAARTAKAAGDPRTMDQLRADALAAVGHNALATGWIGRAPTPAGPIGGARDSQVGHPAATGVEDGSDVVAEPEGPALDGSAPAGRLVCGDPAPGGRAPGGPAPGGPAPGGTAVGERTVGEPVRGEPAAGTPVSSEPMAREAACGAAVASEPGSGQPVCGEPASAKSAGTPIPAGGMPAGIASSRGPGACFRLGSIGGRPARVNVTVPLSVLMGADRDAADAARRRWDPGASDPLGPVEMGEVAVLEGYGPVTPDVARALAMGGVWQRLVTDQTSGTVLDVGRTRYTPPPEMADLVRARDRYCVRPGCGARAQGCDLDHTTPFHLGGRTAVDNLGSLCASDHALKTDGVYRVEQPEAGVFVFHLPSGHSYRRERDGSTTMLDRRDPARDPADESGNRPGRRPGDERSDRPGCPPGDEARNEPGRPPGDHSSDAVPPPF